jgi:hypothetical protein
VAVARALDEGFDHVDPDTGTVIHCGWSWYTQSLLMAIPDDLLTTMTGNTAIAIDGTEVESCGQFQGEITDADGEGGPDDADHAAMIASAGRRPRVKAKVLAIGPDGRKVYTKDPDARASWRTGNANHPAGYYVGGRRTWGWRFLGS